MKTYLAQELKISGMPIQGPLPKELDSLGAIINTLIGFLYPFAGLILFFILVWGGYGLLLSRGDPEKIKGAKGKITSGLIGFILLVLSYFMVKVIAFIFGLNNGVIQF